MYTPFAHAFAYAIKQTPYAFVAKIILCMYLLYDIVFAFTNKAESEQEAVLSDKFLLCIQMIYNLGSLFLKSIIDSLFWADFLAFECVEYVNMAT